MIFNKNIFHLSAIVMATCLIMGCKGTARTADAAKAVHTAPIAIHLDKEQVWQLTAINGRELKPTDDAITISFNPEVGTLKGRTACNTYSAGYKLLNAQLSILNLQSSDLFCPDPAMNAEQRYLGLLRKANRMTVEGNNMTLYSNNREILKFGLQ